MCEMQLQYIPSKVGQWKSIPVITRCVSGGIPYLMFPTFNHNASKERHNERNQDLNFLNIGVTNNL